LKKSHLSFLITTTTTSDCNCILSYSFLKSTSFNISNESFFPTFIDKGGAVIGKGDTDKVKGFNKESVFEIGGRKGSIGMGKVKFKFTCFDICSIIVLLDFNTHL
jgi:hypothetical protein